MRIAKDRRAMRRTDSRSLTVDVKVLGRWSGVSASSLDFNRFGISILSDKPLSKNQRVLLDLQHGTLAVKALVGVVHCCRATGELYRCGIRFRPTAPEQFDRLDTARQLERLENALASEGALKAS